MVRSPFFRFSAFGLERANKNSDEKAQILLLLAIFALVASCYASDTEDGGQ